MPPIFLLLWTKLQVPSAILLSPSLFVFAHSLGSTSLCDFQRRPRICSGPLPLLRCRKLSSTPPPVFSWSARLCTTRSLASHSASGPSSHLPAQPAVRTNSTALLGLG